MGACNSSPAANDGPVAAATNSSPVHAAVMQVKQKRSDSEEATNMQLDAEPQPADSAASNATNSPQPADAASTATPTDGAKAEGGASSRKEKEETKEQTADTRPASASQPKLSARSVAPLPNIAASSAVLPSADIAATAAASSTASASSAASSPSAAADEFPTTLAASSQFSSSDVKYKSTVRDVLVLLLDRFTRTMEYEKGAFQELAIGVGYSNYMQLYDYGAFESFLRLNYVIPPSPSPQQQDNDLRYISQYFSLFLTLAQSGDCDTAHRTMPTRQQLTADMQRLCSATAEQLRKWCVSQHATAEVKEHLLFFSTALQFAEGDLINQPELLYKNIDDICD